MVTLQDCCACLLAFFLPPVGVFLEVGCTGPLFLNILLTILGWLPGVIHAFFVIGQHEGGREPS